jgi:hypothetical protein
LDSSCKGSVWTEIPFLIHDNWKEYLQTASPKSLYNDLLPLPLKTQWALYDLHDIVPEEYQEFYPLPTQPRPGSKKLADVEEDLDDIELEDSESTSEPQEQNEQDDELRRKCEKDSFLEDLMLQVQRMQEDLTEQFFAKSTNNSPEFNNREEIWAHTEAPTEERNEDDEDNEELQFLSALKKRRQRQEEIYLKPDERRAKKAKSSEWVNTWSNADALLGPQGTGRMQPV